MSVMRELDIETLRWKRSPATHFVRTIEEPWSGRDGVAVTFCGRSRPANDIEQRKFSQVRSWCLPCYRSRLRAIKSDPRWTAERKTGEPA